MTRTIAAGALALFSLLASAAPHPAYGEPVVQEQPTRRERWQARRQANRQDADEWRAAWGGLSPDERATLGRAWRDSIARVQDLTPEQRQQILNAAEGVARELQDMTPEQKARLQDYLQRSAESYRALGPEQKQVILTNLADTIDRMKGLPAARKSALKALYRRLLGL